MTELRVVGKRTRYTRRKKAEVVVKAALTSNLAASEATGVPESTIRYWLQDPALASLRDKTREEAAEGFEVLMHMAQGRLRELIPTMEARDLTILLGVATEKAQLLAGAATSRTEMRSLVDDLPAESQDALADEIDAWLQARKVGA